MSYVIHLAILKEIYEKMTIKSLNKTLGTTILQVSST